MALFCITMLSIADRTGRHDPFYQNMAIKYFEHFLYIAHAMTNMDGAGIDLWDEEDQFFYDVIHLPSGQTIPLKMHSMVGLVPLFAVLVVSPRSTPASIGFPNGRHGSWSIVPTCSRMLPRSTRRRESSACWPILTAERLRGRAAAHARPGGISLRLRNPLRLALPPRASVRLRPAGQEFSVKYLPAESDNRLFGGNSNWRGPIWFP